MRQKPTSLHLRLPRRLYLRVLRAATANGVSLNREIINQLEMRWWLAEAARLAWEMRGAPDEPNCKTRKMPTDQ